jgi:hypothetical protein
MLGFITGAERNLSAVIDNEARRLFRTDLLGDLLGPP